MHKIIVLAAMVASNSAVAQYTDGVIKIGVMADMSSLYADISGPGSVAAAKLAVEDFRPAVKGMRIEIISADHQNKPDIAASIAGAWVRRREGRYDPQWIKLRCWPCDQRSGAAEE
jgi:branched-chain amino acid transport system substrate-binding protein